MHLTLSSDGLIRVSEYLTDRVTVLTPSGELLEQIGGETGDGAGQLDAPSGVAELGGLLFIPDFYNHRVQVFGGGNLAIGRSGRVLNGFLHYPTDVATDDSLVFVADAYNHRVQVFRPDGSFVRAWGGPLGRGGRGGLRGWFRVAMAVRDYALRLHPEVDASAHSRYPHGGRDVRGDRLPPQPERHRSRRCGDEFRDPGSRSDARPGQVRVG